MFGRVCTMLLLCVEFDTIHNILLVLEKRQGVAAAWRKLLSCDCYGDMIAKN
jgi:hypothetical protein